MNPFRANLLSGKNQNVRKIIFSVLLYSLTGLNCLFAQNEVSLSFSLPNKQFLSQDSSYSVKPNHSDWVKIKSLRFYLGNIKLINNNQIVFSSDNNYRLIDFADSASCVISLSFSKSISFDAIEFTVGIDSLIQEAGVMGGDLDPVKGMYWSWQSGYIHAKLEGSFSLSEVSDQDFQFHIGGYKEPWNTLQQKRLITNTPRISIVFNPEVFFQKIDLHKHYKLMSPGKLARELSEFFIQSFEIE